MKRGKGRPSTVNYQEIERLYNLVWTDMEIADEIDCSLLTVKVWRKIVGAAPNYELKKWMEKKGIKRG